MKKSFLFNILSVSALALAATIPRASAQLYVGNSGGNTVGEYNLSTGAAVPGFSSPTGLSFPQNMVIQGNLLYVSNDVSGGSVVELNATTGAMVNSSFITGLAGPGGLQILGNTLFVPLTNPGQSTVGTYNATTGAVINASFVTGLNRPNGTALSPGGVLYVCDTNNDRVSEYNASTGALMSANLISLSGTANAVALSGNDLYVDTGNTVGEYNATTGTQIGGFTSPTGLNGPNGLAISGNDLFVANTGNNEVGEYNATTGATINAGFVTGLSGPTGLYVAPEPGSAALAILGSLGLLLRRRRNNAAV